MKKLFLFFTTVLAAFPAWPKPTVELPEYIFNDVAFEAGLTVPGAESGTIELTVNGTKQLVELSNGNGTFDYTFSASGNQQLNVVYGPQKLQKQVSVIPLWWSIVPPLLAILLALVIREVIISLLLGILLGAVVLNVYTQGAIGFFIAFFEVLDLYIISTLNDWGHLAIILFTLLIGSMVAVISKNGGMSGVVNILAKKAQSPRSGQLVTWLLGLAIFFDDYANTLVVGNTMRPVTDKLKISRAKLSYIVDSTAAPVAALAFITTWIGAELSYIQGGLDKIPELAANESAYGVFMSSLQYSFYPVFTILFMFWLIWKKVDFGPMLSAEKEARNADAVTEQKGVDSDDLKEFISKHGVQQKWYNAAIPVVVVIVTTAVGLYITGSEGYTWEKEPGFFFNLSEVIGRSDSFSALLWASFLSLAVAMAMSISQRILNIKETIDAVMGGIKTMMPTIIILTLAWSIAHVTEVMHTADFLTGILQENISVYLLPGITFLLAAVVSFSTGSSWGTMAILYPLILPATWRLATEAGLPYDTAFPVFANTVACVLSGSVLGDHCSPISDTTILSSLACSCDHIEHVRTQLPYALTTGGLAMFLGTVPTAYGMPAWISLLLGIIGIFIIVRYFGRQVDYG